MSGIVPVCAELMTSERLALSRDAYGATPLHKVLSYCDASCSYVPKKIQFLFFVKSQNSLYIHIIKMFRHGYSPKSRGCGQRKIGWGGVWGGAPAAMP